MKIYDAIIIGGGASGLMSAFKLSQKSLSVLVLEGNQKLGKKLLATGNGKCNLCNKNIDLRFFHGDKDKIENITKSISCEDIEEEFHKISIQTISDSQGRVYPQSMQALAVVKAFTDVLHEQKVDIIYNFCAIKAKKEKENFAVISSENQKVLGKNLIISCGSVASPKHGCGEDIFSIIKDFGHNITELKPSLVNFKISDKFLKNLSGVRSKAKVSLQLKDKEIYSEFGEIILSEKGISGICIFNLSSFYKKNHTLLIDLLPEMKKEKVLNILLEIVENRPLMRSSDILNGIINIKLGLAIIKKSRIDFDKKILDLTKNELENIVNNLKNLTFNIDNLGDFENAQVTSGGVPLSEIDTKTMQSKFCKNLYFTGEILNIDGICGGYNLYWAWASAMNINLND